MPPDSLPREGGSGGPICIWQCSEHPEHRGWRTYDEPRGTCDHCLARTAFEHEVVTGGATFTPEHPEGLE